jgi:hypothetical protein
LHLLVDAVPRAQQTRGSDEGGSAEHRVVNDVGAVVGKLPLHSVRATDDQALDWCFNMIFSLKFESGE